MIGQNACKWVANSLVETDLTSVVTSNMTLTELNSFPSLAQVLCPCTPTLFPCTAGDETSTTAYFLIRVEPIIEHNRFCVLCIIGRYDNQILGLQHSCTRRININATLHFFTAGIVGWFLQPISFCQQLGNFSHHQLSVRDFSSTKDLPTCHAIGPLHVTKIEQGIRKSLTMKYINVCTDQGT